MKTVSRRFDAIIPSLFALPLLLLSLAYLAYFAARAWLMLGFAYPLDYGEGPLLAQVELLRSGTPVWRMYADPQAPPYVIVNYPPLYPLLVAGLSQFSGSVLLAGRLTSLLSSLGAVAALATLCTLAQPLRNGWQRRLVWFMPLLLLTVPIVREWGTLLRVDMLGVCLGLWGLVALMRATAAQQSATRWMWAAATVLLMVATLYVKPSLLAAPAAAVLWLAAAFIRGQQRVLAAAIILGIGTLGGLLFIALEQASGGWFALHVVAANANRWQLELARLFWGKQIELRWALGLAALLGLFGLWLARYEQSPAFHQSAILALLYSLAGAITAAGVGKVGAYDNYFLELYAGLVWIVCLAAGSSTQRQPWLQGSILALLAVSLLYYPPLWDSNRLHVAGLVEPSPPRLAVGRYGLWQDQQREAAILAAQSRIYTVLTPEVRAAGPLIFTDMPGVAATAGVMARMQLFEQRQLIDQGLWDERPVLHELANGRLPLAVIDYLGNWMTPAMQTIIQRRYAQDGPRGRFDIYRPVDAGPLRQLRHRFGSDLPTLEAYRLPDSTGFAPGELLPLSLLWQRPVTTSADSLEVVLRLEKEGRALLEHARPLLYGVFPPHDWPGNAPVEHMQPWQLPAELPPGDYDLVLSLRRANGDERESPPLRLERLTVADHGGRYFAETEHYVPAILLAYWERMGGLERAGYPLTPAVPFDWGRLQCFERVCLEERGSQVAQRALGELLYLAETNRSEACTDGRWPDDSACAPFAELWQRYGLESLGHPISGSMVRNGFLVQWTRYARLEHTPASGVEALGRLGDDSLQLSPGQRYRWP